ncbi:hypothetical protein Cgig2_027371 [Carnegiea gigantea]|uniref:Uncharacterized protein n=1 Tax=Carnegiea gigantea TaxID=171969 RepID=A0A9Q1QG01_9CARY|nr:hypothetical protein Cgig2_027371 [Carnegiea gigantea]
MEEIRSGLATAPMKGRRKSEREEVTGRRRGEKSKRQRPELTMNDNEVEKQLAFARYQSLQQRQLHHDQEAFRESKGRFYDEGGSNQAPMRRAATIREGGSRGKGVMVFTPLSTPTETLKAVEIDLEKDRTRTKQSKLDETVKKRSIKAFGSWVIDNNQPFTVVDSIYTNPLLNTIREIGRDVRAPSSYEFTEIYPPEA